MPRRIDLRGIGPISAGVSGEAGTTGRTKGRYREKGYARRCKDGKKKRRKIGISTDDRINRRTATDR
jgi:hypothetical protein